MAEQHDDVVCEEGEERLIKGVAVARWCVCKGSIERTCCSASTRVAARMLQSTCVAMCSQ